MEMICKATNESFAVDEEDLEFYRTVSPKFDGETYLIPPPTLSPAARLRRRLAFANHIFIYSRKCSGTGENIFSMHPQEVPFPVYHNDYWWSDAWDARSYGRAFDFSKPFFEQFRELENVVPHIARYVLLNENSDYCNNAGANKNCYLVFNTGYAEDCMIGESVWSSTDCLDCSEMRHCELCYDCTMCTRCYNTQSSEQCEDCIDSFYLLNCRSCRDCFGCVNLRQKQYCVFNEQLSKEEYLRFVEEANLSSYQSRTAWGKKVESFWLQHPRPHRVVRRAENVSGNYIYESRNIKESTIISESENLKYCFHLDDKCQNCYDYAAFGRSAELVYEAIRSGINLFNVRFCYCCLDGCTNLLYSAFCFGTQDSFGCVGLKKNQYCLLNKQYTKQEYEQLMPKIIGHMQETGEWGEFFPIENSPVPYNRSYAQRYFPLSKAQIEDAGLRWYDKPFFSPDGAVAAEKLPDGLPPADDAITTLSAASKAPFRITGEEIRRLRMFNAPLPRLTYDERFDRRVERLGGLSLCKRFCEQSGQPIETTFPPDSPWVIWDKEVYEQEFSA